MSYLFSGSRGKNWFDWNRMSFSKLESGESRQIKKAILGTYGVRLSKWEHGIFVSGSSPIYNEQELTGQVYTGVLIDNSLFG